MKKRKTGWIIVLIVAFVAALLCGAYFVVTRVLHVDLPFFGSGDDGDVAYVQTVAKILGVGYTGRSNRYSGVVEAKEVIEINPDSTLTIETCFVAAGDAVSVGTPLFQYDVDSLTLSYEQTLIDITGLENTIRTAIEESESLEKQIARARADKQYELKLKLQEVQLTQKKSEYELKSKQKQADQLKEAIEDSVVKSPVNGRVRSVRTENDANNMFGTSDTSNAYITIVAGSDFCVKGKVNEQTAHTLSEGMIVTIRSRTNENETYRGEIYRINTEEPIKENNYYSYDGGGEQSSKYAFYVSSDEIGHLMMGQHVYIELGEPDKQGSSLVLPSYYLVEEEGRHFVYAANAKNRIEKRTVTLGAYMEETDSYEIIDGLTYTDRIAFPDETVREGMTASETVYADETGMLGEEPMDFEAPIDMEEPFDAEQLDETEFGDGGWE